MAGPQGESLHKKVRASNASPPKRLKISRFELHVLPDDLWLKVRGGDTVHEALRQAGINLGECGGLGKCGKCKTEVLSSIKPPCEEEKRLLGKNELEQGIRLACRTIVDRDLVVYLAEPGFGLEFYQILMSGYRRRFRLY